ncbi:hypothetical protein AAHE18_11G147000 [Arachis hypogaea]
MTKARQPNPIIYRRLRRGSFYPTNKELLRTIAYLRNATAPDRMLAYNKAYINDEDDDDEEGDTIRISDRGQVLTEKLQQTDSIRKTFMQFCSAEIIYPPEHPAVLAVKLLGVQAALLTCLGSPFKNLPLLAPLNPSLSKIQLSLFQASTKFLPAMIWTGMFIVSFANIVMVAWSLGFRMPIISMLCLLLLYSLSVLVAAASEFSVICDTFRIYGTLFTCLGVFGFVMVLVGLVMLVLLYSWLSNPKTRCIS